MSCSAAISGIDGAFRAVVGVGLEGDAEHGDGFARILPPKALATFRAIARLRWSFTAITSRRCAAAPRCPGRFDQRQRVLGEAGAAEARTCMQEFEPMRLSRRCHGRPLHVGADLFGEIGDLVDESDLGRAKTRCGVFRELRRAAVV